MYHLFVGVCQTHLYFRHARSLKDKRQVLKSLSQRLKNEGFSVTECGYQDDVKQGSLGFAFAGHNHSFVEKTLEESLRMFLGDFDLVRTHKDIFDYSDMAEEEIPFETEET